MPWCPETGSLRVVTVWEWQSLRRRALQHRWEPRPDLRNHGPGDDELRGNRRRGLLLCAPGGWEDRRCGPHADRQQQSLRPRPLQWRWQPRRELRNRWPGDDELRGNVRPSLGRRAPGGWEDRRGRLDGGSGKRSVRPRALSERCHACDDYDDDSLDDRHVDLDHEQHLVHDHDHSPTEGMPARLSTRGQGVRRCLRGQATNAPPLQASLPEPTEELRRIDRVSAAARVVPGAASCPLPSNLSHQTAFSGLGHFVLIPE
jgi:hypothetical protein